MQPAPTNVNPNVSPPETASDTATTSNHGHHRDDDLQDSPHPHSGGVRGEPRTPSTGSGRDASRTSPTVEASNVLDACGLKSAASSTPPPRDRISEYENALSSPAKKSAEGPLFEVVKSNRRPDDKSSPIANLPNEILIHAIAHLSPNDLAAVSLVSRRFNNVVTTPHAWQVAFARYFPGPLSLEDAEYSALEERGTVVRSEKRRFMRLTALASWRSEYMLRTRLLRSLYRGKPNQLSSAPSRAGQAPAAAPASIYDAKTYTIINHLHAAFGDSGSKKRMPRLIHGANDVGMVTSSDPTVSKVDPWGQSDPFFYGQFSERFPGVAEWGLGAGEMVGRPNVMDVSQPYGMIYGQGCPEGSCYFRFFEEMRGRFVAEPSDFALAEAGIPKLGVDGGAICSVWIAKSNAIPSLSEGLVGLMMGSAAGVVSACSIGTDGLRTSRVQRGELTARWVLSPGVPIVAIAVDENYSPKRHAQNRIWAIALNALGELFYLTKFPTRSQAPKGDIEEYTEYLGWLTGRSVYWNLVEPSRRTARPDPYSDSEVDGSYSPRTSWDGMCLSKEQVIAETREIQQFLRKPPKHFRKSCLGWDMRRRLEVDFAGDDGNFAGEAMIVFECGLDDATSNIVRFTRWKTHEKDKSTNTSTRISTPQPSQATSLFGGSGTGTYNLDLDKAPMRARSSSYMSMSSSPERASLVEEWRCSKLTFGGFKNTQLATTTIDISTFATLTLSEDPALGFSTISTASSPYASPMSVASQPAAPSDIPGHRARLMAAGTKMGVVILWDVRAPVSHSSEYTNNITPVRIIYTDSPEISCLALTGLLLVVGGNDGLVQAWDPLASSMSPIKTLNSRHASRARRRLVQAQASVQGVGINMYAAGAVCLDPDPTVLRGAVSLGNHLKYWSFSSSAADQYKSSKRRLRRAERGSNNAVERFSGTGCVNLKDYIANETFELERDKQERRKQADRLAGRFGTELLSEDEALEYAAMLSQESMEAEATRRRESTSATSIETITPEPSVGGQSSSPAIKGDDELDADIAEAIRLSLNDSPGSGMYDASTTPPSAFEFPIKYAKGKKFMSSPRSKASPSGKGKAAAGSGHPNELSDLEYAMQLSLAEEQSRKDSEDVFPPLNPAQGRGSGKGKGRMW